MKRLSVRHIRNLCIGYFALVGLVFLTLIFSSQPGAIAIGLVLFVLSILPVLLPFRGFRLFYGLMALMVAIVFLFVFAVQVFQWKFSDLLSGIVIAIVILGYLSASIGLALTSIQSSDPKRFTLI